MGPEEREGHTKTIVRLIRRLVQAGEHYTKELEKEFHVSAPQLACIDTLYELGPMTPSKIARNIMVNSSTVTGIIDRLEKKNLVARVRDSRDRRMITIQLTEAGRELAQAAPPPVSRKMLEGLKNLPDDELRAIVYGLNKLAGLLDVEELTKT